MKMGKKKIQKFTAWILLIVMGIHCFGDAVPSAATTVYATDYEKASEEAEEEIRKAEQAAGIGQSDKEDAEVVEGEVATESTVGETQESLAGKSRTSSQKKRREYMKIRLYLM